MLLLYILFFIFNLCFLGNGLYSLQKFETIADKGNYSCDEIARWLGTEKHYSNDKRKTLFSFLANKNCETQKYPVALLHDIAYGWSTSGKRTYFELTKSKIQKCIHEDEYVVTYLSNFSINNNFSHFLHGLLRLFCALVDANWLSWNHASSTFTANVNYTIWLDEYFKVDEAKMVWIKSLGSNIRHLNNVSKGQCFLSKSLLYGSGCVKLLPPEKWFGYPGCRSAEVLPAFGHFMRKKYMANDALSLITIDEYATHRIDPGVRVAFAVRDVGPETGRRSISNLLQVQNLLRKTQHIRSSTENVTFEHLDVPSTIRYMASVHVFISVHGAGMTNMFFMNPGSAVLEIIPYPLCDCRSPDYFYGPGGYYYGSAIAQSIRHYHYCVPAEHVKWHKQPKSLESGMKCSWRYLHAVESIYIDPSKFVSLMRNIERDLIAIGTIVLTKPIINISPHANG